MHELALDGSFPVALLQIIAIDVLLGGDNAVVIALACRRLPPRQRKLGVLWGAAGAIALRILLLTLALQLLRLPFLKIAGALMLLWIGIKLLRPAGGEETEVAGSSHLLGAIRTIVVADAAMSIDNVVAVAGAARGNLPLVALGVLISIPIIVWGSRLVLQLMDRFPAIVTLGGALLGWIAGQMWLGDAWVEARLDELPPYAPYLCSVLGALLVIGLGRAGTQDAR